MSKRRSRRSTRREVVDYTPAVEQVDFANEYRYVLSDLRRFALLAMTMFALLVILALILG